MGETATGECGNLPAPLTSFVGRDRHLGQLTRLLEAQRLVDDGVVAALTDSQSASSGSNPRGLTRSWFSDHDEQLNALGRYTPGATAPSRCAVARAETG
jgi:hypothetical protein